jgi:hypothetical protein
MNDSIVDVTTQISIFTQLAVGLFNIYGLNLSLPEEHLLLKDILVLETIVQVIEFCWYFFVIQYLPQDEMAKNRYYDWVISTPLMLVSLFSYLLYEDHMENNPNNPPIRLSFIMENYRDSIVQIILSNFFMLSIGYLYEIGKITKDIAFAYGLVFLLNTFSIIYMKAIHTSMNGKIVFFVMFLLWSIYGIAFILPTATKNSIFNITDLFSKNFFEVYITIVAINKNS